MTKTALVLPLLLITLLSSCTTPTGTIAFSCIRDGNPEIYLINADGTGLQRLTYAPSPDTNPVFSPDGQHIAFNSVVDDNLDVYVMHKDGSPAINFSNSPGDDVGTAWARASWVCSSGTLVSSSPPAGDGAAQEVNATSSSSEVHRSTTRLIESPPPWYVC